MKHYVLGFAVDRESEAALLIRKTKPAWQRGYLNGIGGSIELYDSTPTHAMVREFFEETQIPTQLTDWTYLGTMGGSDWSCELFYTQKVPCDFSFSHESNEGTVGWFSIVPLPVDILPNLNWLLGLVTDQDHIESITVRYKN